MRSDDAGADFEPVEPGGTGEPGGDAAAPLEDTASGDAAAEPAWERRRRLDAVFGESAHGQSLGDRWYRDQVPPHHG